MTFELVLFYILAAMLLIAASAVVLVRNPVHAALSLVLTFFTCACLWLLMRAEFLGIALVLVYVGAVMVLFLFVVMMLDVEVAPLREGFTRYLPVGIAVAAIMFGEMFSLLGVRNLGGVLAAPDAAAAAKVSNTQWLGTVLFSEYMLPFEVAAVILTVAIVAAVALTLRHRGGTKHQKPSKQVLTRKEDRLRIVKMPAQMPKEPTP
jgi:NADH-quinone oxidoreductase subunit J